MIHAPQPFRQIISYLLRTHSQSKLPFVVAYMFHDLLSNPLADRLFETSDAFIGLYDLHAGLFVRVNRAGVRLLGFDSEPLLLADPVLSRSLRTDWPVDDYRTYLTEQLSQDEVYQDIFLVARRGNPPFWGQSTVTAFRDHERPYALVRLIDQGLLHQTERALDHSIRRYEAIFFHASIGMVVCNERGRITSANHLANKLFGYEADELMALTIEDLVPISDRQPHAALRLSFMRHPQVRPMGHNRALNARRKDGTVFPVEISLSHFQLEDEGYAVAYIIDVTVEKAAERQLLNQRDDIQRLNANLEEKVADRTNALMNTLGQLEQAKDKVTKALAAEQLVGELKSRFVSMASHEFRTPLTVLQTSTMLVEKYLALGQPGNCQTHLDQIRVSIRHLTDILDEFLSVGMIDAGKIEVHPVAVDVGQLIRETVAAMQGLLKPGQRVETDLVGEATVWLDPSLLRKIILNLLTNAVKYSGPGAVVRIRATTAVNLLVITVADQGIGIHPDDQRHLFEQFFRARNVSNIAGTGLGLHIVGQYVALMGGQVALQSALNEGTLLTLTFPYHDNHIAD